MFPDALMPRVRAAGGRGLSGHDFTEECRQTLARARGEARQLQHRYLGPEHILLALSRSQHTEAARVLGELGVSSERVRESLEASIARGRGERNATKELPYTSGAKRVIHTAMAEAEGLGHGRVGTEHLLLGLLREEKGIAARVLNDLGVALDDARGVIMRERGTTSRRPFHMHLDDSSARSIYEQIIAQVQEAVATGRLRPRDRLPTVRHLADELDIAPGTVARAYGELERLGVVVTEGSRGTRVADVERQAMADNERPLTLIGLLRPVAVAAFHLGATAIELREALEEAMKGIFGQPDAA